MQELFEVFWRQIDAIVGLHMGLCKNLWSANDLSDGWFVESRLMAENVW